MLSRLASHRLWLRPTAALYRAASATAARRRFATSIPETVQGLQSALEAKTGDVTVVSSSPNMLKVRSKGLSPSIGQLVSLSEGTKGVVVHFDSSVATVLLLKHDTPVGTGTRVQFDNLGTFQAVRLPFVPIIDRIPVSRRIRTGLGLVDALSPIAEGQSIAIRGPSTANSIYMALALNKIVSNAIREDITVVYCNPLGPAPASIADLPCDGLDLICGDQSSPAVGYLALLKALEVAKERREGGRTMLILDNVAEYVELNGQLRSEAGIPMPLSTEQIVSAAMQYSCNTRSKLCPLTTVVFTDKFSRDVEMQADTLLQYDVAAASFDATGLCHNSLLNSLLPPLEAKCVKELRDMHAKITMKRSAIAEQQAFGIHVEYWEEEDMQHWSNALAILDAIPLSLPPAKRILVMRSVLVYYFVGKRNLEEASIAAFIDELSDCIATNEPRIMDAINVVLAEPDCSPEVVEDLCYRLDWTLAKYRYNFELATPKEV
ncbi:Produces ATP from ADP in the presence of a proton gradient across the membrane [Perkinsus olseni]|uniref:Produces ATP from ADP in the presence of a proton gradient across the membrane n=1 Tax=Perkinsus olseni TaxID=32597 RepID=A0A7J6U4F9_PEROL|nr:Produces ATP from ADP in the presence of a proton gradient across the membrane [Perkinsus olseni]KAF4752413.1 Produces ATP from ADP in the presence of a proton gradient across the membrane [Perkinsus olseni]